MNKRVHFIGISGKLTGPLAVALKKNGWKVSGSDHLNIYPPVRDYLDFNKINYSLGFNEKNIKRDLDLVIVGGSAFHFFPNPEVEKAKKFGLKIISQSQAIADFVIRKNSIVIAGSYGKTTTTAMIVSILKEAGFNPSYMIGEILTDESEDPLKITDSDWSVVEGDEYPTYKFDSTPKFCYYRPKYVILTGCRWEHQDVYQTEEAYLAAFRNFLKLVPKEGFIIANKNGENIDKILKGLNINKYFYSLPKTEQSSFWVSKFELLEKGSRFVLESGELNFPLEIGLIGKHNVENSLAAASLCLKINISKEKIFQGLKNFKGLKKRLQVEGVYKGVRIVKDVSQTQKRVKAALQTLKEVFPTGKLIVVFYPHYTGLLYKTALKEFMGMFDKADFVIITKIFFRKEIPKEQRVDGKMILEKVKETQPKAEYIPKDELVVKRILKLVEEGDTLLFLSSGGFRKIDEKIVEDLKERRSYEIKN